MPLRIKLEALINNQTTCFGGVEMSLELGRELPELNKGLLSERLYPDIGEPKTEESLRHSIYPSLADLNKIRPLDIPVAASLIKVEEPTDEQAVSQRSAYSQPISASYGIPQIFSWFWSSKAKSSKPLIQWEKDLYPAKQDFIEASKLYYGPRIIYIPHTTKAAQFQSLVHELEMAHHAYMEVMNALATAYSQKVRREPLSSRITQYNAAIKECSELFETINKQRQVARDLRGFFLNHLIEDEGENPLSQKEADTLIHDHLVPFAATGDPQHPFARVTRPSSGVQYVTLGRDKRRPNLFEVPDFQVEKGLTEAAIRSKVFIEEAPLALSLSPSPATLAATLQETAEKALKRDTTVNLLEWKAELKQLHEEYRSLVQDGASPLSEHHRLLDGYLIRAHLALKWDVQNLEKDSSEENKRTFMANLALFNHVKQFFNGIHEAMGDEAPTIFLMTKDALEFEPEIDGFHVVDL